MKDFDKIIRFRIFGEPQPEPKKDVATVKMHGKIRLVPVHKDYRTRKNQVTGKVEKWDRGYKAKWKEIVRRHVASDLHFLGREPYPAHFPVACGMLFFITKPPSNTSEIPTGKPDFDNYWESVANALKCPDLVSKQTAELRRLYPKGVLWYDDSLLKAVLEPSGVLWATETEPPGLLLSVCAMKFVGWVRGYLQQTQLPLEPTLKNF